MDDGVSLVDGRVWGGCATPPGLGCFLFFLPGLTPWAKFCRASGAWDVGVGEADPGLTPWAKVCRASGASELQLLLVVDGGGGDFFAGGVCAFGGYGAGFAVGGEDAGAGEENLAPFLTANVRL